MVHALQMILNLLLLSLKGGWNGALHVVILRTTHGIPLNVDKSWILQIDDYRGIYEPQIVRPFGNW
jgi:hypothetical protein